ncbi:hypothetical protein ACOMHN_043583 [Nucella lapillus]
MFCIALISTLGEEGGRFYPNLHKLLQLVCTLPITTSECERSISRLRTLKTYLRSTMVNNDALALVTELIRVFTSEAAERSAVQAKKDGSHVVSVEHLEKILPQLPEFFLLYSSTQLEMDRS